MKNTGFFEKFLNKWQKLCYKKINVKIKVMSVAFYILKVKAASVNKKEQKFIFY